jgi:hypothetical protein
MAVLILPFPEEKTTGSQVKAVRVLFIAGAPHPFSVLPSPESVLVIVSAPV